MKIFGLVLAIVCFLCFSPSAFGELSVEDLEKIRQIVDEVEVRLGKRIDDVEVRLGKRIDDVEVRLGKRINEVEVGLGKRIDGVEKQLGDRITSESQALGKRIDFQGHLIIALIVAIIAFVAVPMGVIVYQYNRNRDQQEAKIRAVRDQQEEIKVLRQRIEELERERLIQA